MAVVSLGTAVGWVVSPLIKIMIDKTRSYVSGQYSWSSDMMRNLTKLEDNLTQILLVVGVAERRKIVEPNQAMLLHRIKDVVYEAEDVMDEFDYMLLKERVEKQKNLTYLASSSLSFGKRLVGLDEFRPKLKKVIDKLNRVKASAEVFLHVMGTENDTSSIRQTQISKLRVTNSVSHEVVIGRDEERDKLIEMLLMLGDEANQSNMYHPKVISVVGDGGELLGSTEFPLSGLKPEHCWSLFNKYAFDGENLEDHPDLEAIGKQIVENLGGSALAIKVIGGQLNANFGFEE
ncbi:hypothetical protein LUZ60_007094 [Juncus effusus]|nr:hypothetical protein LUZ60_007094 [Juncus effusus]